MTHLTPHQYQQIAVEFMVDHERCNLWAGMGMGKTVAALMADDVLRLAGDTTGPTLALGPLRVARDVWPAEPLKWDQYADIKIIPIVGTTAQREAALRQKGNFFTCNYDQLEWLVERLGDSWPFETVIADESTRLKGYRMNSGGRRVTALAEVAHAHTRRWINLTGTPAPKGLEDLWGQNWFVDHGQRLGRTHTAFMSRFFRPKFSGYGVELMPFSDKLIHEALKDVTLTLDPKDWFDIQEPITKVVKVELPARARKVYDDLEDELFAELMSGDKIFEIEVFNQAGLTNKCLQVASGAVYTQHPAWEAVHGEKLEALASVVEEAGGMPVLVSIDFQFDKERILNAFKGAVDISTPKGYKKFRDGDARIGVAHPGSMGHGIDGLQYVTNIICYYGHTWRAEWTRQILERIGPVRQLQAGFQRPVWVYQIVARKTLDLAVLDRAKGQLRVEDALREYMKRR